MGLKKLLESSIDHFGTSDIITILISQRLDKQIVSEQKELNRLEEVVYQKDSTNLTIKQQCY